MAKRSKKSNGSNKGGARKGARRAAQADTGDMPEKKGPTLEDGMSIAAALATAAALAIMIWVSGEWYPQA